MKRGYLILGLALLAAAMLFMSGIGTRAGFWSFRTGFTILKWSAYAGIATSILALVALLLPRVRAGQWVPLLSALVIAAAVAYVPWSWQRRARTVPPIHDITTDTERPPEFVAILPLRADARNPSAYGGNEIAEQQRRAYPDIQPIMLNVGADSAFRLAHAAAQRMGWEIVAVDSADSRIEATATTTWFGFKDDVVIRVAPAQQGSRVDVRSVSRVGRGDVGTNAARIRKYMRTITRLR